MKHKYHSGNRWIIFVPVAILALFSPQANAEPILGLQTTYYTIDAVPPTRSDNIYTVCGSEVENNINRSYDGEPYLDCTVDLFMVHMTGFITIPEHNTIEFWLASDDGGIINIDGNEWGNWWDQGCTWMESGPLDISAGSQPLDVWMYENGGSTCIMLAWNINNQGWSIVPDEAFTTIYSPTTTTSIEETTTTWESTTTSTTTTTTTTTIAPSTTVPVVEEPTTTILQTTTTLPPDTTIPEPTTTVPEPETTEPIETIPPETLEVPPTTVDTVPDTTIPDTTVPDTTIPDTTIPDTLPDAPKTPETVPNDIVDEIPEELVQALEEALDSGEPLTEEQFVTAVEALADLDPEEAVALIEQILNTEVTVEQALELASNPDVLDVIAESQAEEIFATIDVTSLDNTQLDALVKAVQFAPTQVRNAFESTINIFGDGLGDYVPLGSTVPVDTRRTLIAVAAGAATVAVGSRRNK
jgi:hypothetical protein